MKMMAASWLGSNQTLFPDPLFCGEVPQLDPLSREDSLSSQVEEKAPHLAPLASLEFHRLKFRLGTLPPGETPLETLSRLDEAAHQWLCPETCTKEQIVDMVILEQFLAVLPADLQVWLRAREPSDSKAAARLAETYQRQQEPADVAQLPVTFEDLSVSFTEKEWALLDARQKNIYWKVMEENYENVSSVAVWVSNNDLPHSKGSSFTKVEARKLTSTQPESTHPLSACTFGNSDIMGIDIKTETVCQQEDPQEEGDEMISVQIKEEDDDEDEDEDESWCWPGVQQGSHLQEGENESVELRSTLGDKDKCQIHLKTGQERNDHTYALPAKPPKCISSFAACQKLHSREISSHRRPEREKYLNLRSDFMGQPEILTKLKPYFNQHCLTGNHQNEYVTLQSQSPYMVAWDGGRSQADNGLANEDMEINLQQEAPMSEKQCESSEGFAKANVTHNLGLRNDRECHHEAEKQPERNQTREEDSSLLHNEDGIHQCNTATVSMTTEGEDASHKCTRCGQCFESCALLIAHQTSRRRSFVCPLCGKGFEHYTNCIGHLKGIHNDFERRPKCLKTISSCSVYPGQEKAHSEKLHCLKKLHCLECGKHFDHQVDFAAHQLEHRKVMVCYDCGQTFPFKSDFVQHRVLCRARGTEQQSGDSGKASGGDSAVAVVFNSYFMTFN